MPLSTPAKVTIGVLAGAATLAGIGVAVARAGGKGDDEKKPKGGGGMRRDDGTPPAAGDREVVQFDMKTLVDAGADETGLAVSVGDRNEIRLPDTLIAEFAAGRRIETVAMGKVVAGKLSDGKSWSLVTPSFEVSHRDAVIAYDAETSRLSFSADRAGLYVLALKDQDGDEIGDELYFRATSKAAAA